MSLIFLNATCRAEQDDLISAVVRTGGWPEGTSGGVEQHVKCGGEAKPICVMGSD